MLGNIQPDAILVEGVLVREKAFEIATAFLSGGICIHGGILLMTKDDSLTWATFTTSFATLRTLGLLFVACESVSREARQNKEGKHTFKLTSPTCQAGLVSRGACRHGEEAYHPVRDRIPGDVGATWGCGLSGGERNLETCGDSEGQVPGGNWTPQLQLRTLNTLQHTTLILPRGN
jgi:hypothetical protein